MTTRLYGAMAWISYFASPRWILDFFSESVLTARADARSAEEKDRDLLLGAVVGVVLQRDISLTRRVYSWLLGSSETSETQVEFFKQNGLDSLSALLQLEMRGDTSSDHSPFRVFLALLDKWEIGSLLAERLVIPALRSIKQSTTSEEVRPIENAS